MNNLCIIPARGGSKRIQKKNIRDFLGRPIMAYSIEIAVASGLFSEIMVSTDDEEIAAIAEEHGAKVPFMRSNKNSDDFATLADVVDEVFERYDLRGVSFKYGCCILPTAPTITLKDIVYGFEMVQKANVDSVRPVARFSYPIQRAFRMKDGRVSSFFPEYKTTRSQDLEPAFHDAGQFFWFNANTRMRGERRFGFEIDPVFVQDIDTLEDWRLAELKYNMIRQV